MALLYQQSICILVLPPSDPLSVPNLTNSTVTNSAVTYQVRRNDGITDPLITGYEVIRFVVPMIGEYVNAGRGRRVTISPAVPGVQYRITAWALSSDNNGRRSARPAVEYATTGEASETNTFVMHVIRVLCRKHYVIFTPVACF